LWHIFAEKSWIRRIYRKDFEKVIGDVGYEHLLEDAEDIFLKNIKITKSAECVLLSIKYNLDGRTA